MSHSWNLLWDDALSLDTKVAKLQSAWTSLMQQQVAAYNTEVAIITKSSQRQWIVVRIRHNQLETVTNSTANHMLMVVIKKADNYRQPKPWK